MTIKKMIVYSGTLLGAAAAVLVFSLVALGKSEQAIEDARHKQWLSFVLADELKESSRSLTSAVQMFVVTGNERYAEEYMDIIAVRAGEKQRPADREIAPGQRIALGELMAQSDYTEYELSLLRQAAFLSDMLIDLEVEAMNAARGLYPDVEGVYTIVGEPDRERAMELVFSPEYEAEVSMIMAPIALIGLEIDNRLEGTVAAVQENHARALRTVWSIIGVLIMMFGVFLLMVALIIVRPILICDTFARQIAAGKLDSPLDYESDNEIGSLAASLRVMLQSLLERINLEENMRYFSAVISSVDAGVVIKDRDCLITNWNAGAESILGYSFHEIVGKSTKYYAPEESHADIEEIEERLKRGEHITHVDVVRKRSDGLLVNCSASYTPIFDDDGGFAGSVSIFHDVTEKKLAEQRAHKLAAIVSFADAGIIVKDKAGVVQEWNIGAENILGYTAEEIIGHTTKYYAPEESHAGIDEIEKRLENGEHTAHMDVVRKHKDGRLIDCSASYTPIQDDNGEFAGSVAIFHDVTEGKLAGRKAINLAAIVSVADAGIVVKDENCNVLEWNIGAENILGYKAEEIIGKHTRSYVPEEGWPEVDMIKERLLRGEHTTHVEVVRRHKDRRLIDCSASYTPIFDEKGRFTGSVAVFQDISEKKQMEQDLKEALRIAEKASTAKSTFLANMSHEIRTPMNGVIGFAELALGDDNVSEHVRECLKKIMASADCLLQIINDILDISKIEAGVVDLEKIPFDLHAILRDCESICAASAVEKDIAIHFYSEPCLWKKLVGDPTKLRQALLNLMTNAIKFTNYGMVKMTALVEEQADDWVKICFEVKDSGIGMTDEQISNIFEPFMQADSSTTRKYGGTGLGLSITKTFIEMMGGELRVESTLGLGSKFSFSLVFETSVNPSVVVHDIKPTPMQKPMFCGDVLVCEDNPTNQEVVRLHLSRIGLTPVIVDNGRQGLDAVKERMITGNPFCLILMDIHMPVMDGLEAMQKLLDMGIKTPVIALTANAMVTEKENYLKKGMADYLSKPYTAQELWLSLLRHLTPVGYMPPVEKPPAAEILQTVRRPLIITDVLNEKKGIENATGNEQFYSHLQKNFVRDNQNVIHTIKDAICRGKVKRAHRMAHTLKGSARLIGAERLADAAHAVELALFHGETDGLSPYMDALETAMQEALATLKPILPHDEPAPAKVSEYLDKARAEVLFSKLNPLLKSANPVSLDFIEEVKAVLSPLGDVCDKMIWQMEDFDFDVAYETICDIEASLQEASYV